MIKNVMMTFCLIVTVLFIWVWHHQTQFNDHSRKAMFHFNNGELDDAIEAYTKAIKYKSRTIFFTQDPSAYNNLGQAYLHKGNYEEAVSTFTKVLEMVPNAAQVYVNLGTTYLKQHKPKLAIEASQQALRLVPDFALAHYNMACAYALDNEKEKAIASLKKAVDLDENIKAFAHEEPAFDSLRPHPLLSE